MYFIKEKILKSLFLKRIIDIIGALIGIILSAPLMIIIYFLIRITMGKPVIFRQIRPGYKGNLFIFYKFRTMEDLRIHQRFNAEKLKIKFEYNNKEYILKLNNLSLSGCNFYIPINLTPSKTLKIEIIGEDYKITTEALVVRCEYLKKKNIYSIGLKFLDKSKLFKLQLQELIKECSEFDIKDDEKRITPLGKILRLTSLDELPQLFNVLKGDMSLVGPRPLLVKYLKRYNKEQARRHDVKPGITGLAQVYGRNNISWEERFKLDVEYVDNWNILLDLKIIFLTFIKVLKREGVTTSKGTLMPEFNPTKKEK